MYQAAKVYEKTTILKFSTAVDGVETGDRTKEMATLEIESARRMRGIHEANKLIRLQHTKTSEQTTMLKLNETLAAAVAAAPLIHPYAIICPLPPRASVGLGGEFFDKGDKG